MFFFPTPSAVCLWDIRQMKSKKSMSVWTGMHGKSVDSAYFSPLTGSNLLTTSMDDTLEIFDTQSLHNIKRKQTIR